MDIADVCAYYKYMLINLSLYIYGYRHECCISALLLSSKIVRVKRGLEATESHLVEAVGTEGLRVVVLPTPAGAEPSA